MLIVLLNDLLQQDQETGNAFDSTTGKRSIWLDGTELQLLVSYCERRNCNIMVFPGTYSTSPSTTCMVQCSSADQLLLSFAQPPQRMKTSGAMCTRTVPELG